MSITKGKIYLVEKEPGDTSPGYDACFEDLSGGTGITQLTGDVTAGPGSGSQAATLVNSGATAGTYGDATHVSQVTVNAKGLVTAVSSVAITGVGGGSGAAIYTSALASPPGSPVSGDLWLPTDSYYVLRYSGSAWVPWGPLFPMTDPALAAPTTWVNQGTATISTASGGAYLTVPAAAGVNVRGRFKTAPATPYTITAAFLPTLFNVNFTDCGLAWYDGTAFVVARIAADASGTYIAVSKYTNTTTFSASYVTVLRQHHGLVWLRISDNGTNRVVEMSTDGQNWIQIHSVGRTDFLTPTQVGFYANAGQSTWPAAMALLSWRES